MIILNHTHTHTMTQSFSTTPFWQMCAVIINEFSPRTNLALKHRFASLPNTQTPIL